MFPGEYKTKFKIDNRLIKIKDIAAFINGRLDHTDV